MKYSQPIALLLTAAALTCPAQAQLAGIGLTAGVDGFVSVPYDPAFAPSTGLTVEAWIKYDDSTLPAGWNYPTVCRQGLAAGEESFFLRVEAENSNRTVLRWRVTTEGGNAAADWTFLPGQLNVWTHVAGSYDGAMARLFVDGVEVGAAAGSGAIVDNYDSTRPNDFALNIGRGSPQGGIEVFNGCIDEFRLWPFARTAAEIAQCKDTALFDAPDGISSWTFDNTYDDLTFGRDGIVNGAVAFVAPSPAIADVLGGFSVGTSTAGCEGHIAQSMASQFKTGNSDFALLAHSIPAGALSVCQLSFGGTLPVGIPVLGFDLWIDVSVSVGVPAVESGLGVVRAALPISAGSPSGLTIGSQFFTIDPCGPLGITASDALSLTIF